VNLGELLTHNQQSCTLKVLVTKNKLDNKFNTINKKQLMHSHI